MISRRTLAKSALAGAVWLGMGVVHAADAAADESLSADIVVVGAGSAGLTAAVQAAEKGAKVILLEKNSFIGGNSQHAEGIFAVESELNRLRSDTLTREEAFRGLMERHMYEISAPLTRDYVWRSGENVDWLRSHGAGMEVVRMTPWEEATWHVFTDYKGVNHGAALVKCMQDNAERLGVKLMTSTPATDLIIGKSGEIAGVRASSKGKTLAISAKAVILASGSFGDSKELVQKWADRDPEGWKSSVPINKTGDGILMAMRAGAARGRVGFIGHLGAEGKAIGFAQNLYTTSWQPAALWVNTDGERFINEDVAFSFSQAANVVYSQFGHHAWSVFDDAQVEYMMNRGVDSGIGVIVPVGAKLPHLREEMKAALEADSDGFKAASSPAELARKIGVPAETFEAAIKNYNAACRAQHDGQFFKDVRYMRELDTSKLYAIKLRANFFSAYGGLNINRAFEVLDTENRPIKGLYAAGLEVSGMVGHTYTTWSSGHAFGFACYSGRYSALSAAAYLGL